MKIIEQLMYKVDLKSISNSCNIFHQLFDRNDQNNPFYKLKGLKTF